MIDFSILNNYVFIDVGGGGQKPYLLNDITVVVGLNPTSYRLYNQGIAIPNANGKFSDFSLDTIPFANDLEWREFFTFWFGSNPATFTSLESLKDDIERLTWSAYIKSDLPLINQTALFEPYFIRDTFPNVVQGLWSLNYPYDGDYEVILSYQHSYNSGNTSFESDLTFNGISQQFTNIVEPKDTGGGGLANVPTVANRVLTGSTVNTGTSQRLLTTKSFIYSRSAGQTDDVDFVFRGTGNNNEPCIYNAILTFNYKVNKNE